MTILIYAVKMILISGLLYGYFRIFLHNKAFHRYNRVFLIGIVVIALLLPAIKIPIPGSAATMPGGTAVKLLRVTNGDWEEAVTITAGGGWMSKPATAKNLGIFIYIIGVGVLLFGFVHSLLYIYRISHHYPFEKWQDIKFFQTDEKGTPFSFFRRIFWSREIDLHSVSGQQIFRHEWFHVQQRHSLDIILLESVTILCWFNPFFHLIKKEVKAIHEFLADEWAASGTNRHEYAELLVQQSIQHKYRLLIHPFFQNQLKRRITMITQWQNLRNSYGSRLMALPVLLILFSVFAFKIKGRGLVKMNEKNITVIIDAGHGGTDAGSIGSNGSTEKEISLKIAARIRDLAKEYNVTAILTRDKDELAGGSGDSHKSLEYRAGLAAKSGADLFVSIHLNANPKNTGANGFEIYLSDEQTPLQSRSIAFGSLLAESIKKDYTVADELKQRSKGVYILKSATVPAVLLECGYLTNERDEAFIRDEKNQEKIARDILESIVEYQSKVDQHAITLTAASLSELTAETKTESAVLLDTDTVPGKPVLTDVTSKVYKKVEFEAEYPGGREEWAKYLNTHLHYPDKAVDKEIQGDVVVEFIVGSNGVISDVKAISGPELLRAEAVRIIKESGDWTPARNGNLLVKSYKRQPIKYRLEQQG